MGFCAVFIAAGRLVTRSERRPVVWLRKGGRWEFGKLIAASLVALGALVSIVGFGKQTKISSQNFVSRLDLNGSVHVTEWKTGRK